MHEQHSPTTGVCLLRFGEILFYAADKWYNVQQKLKVLELDEFISPIFKYA